MAKIDPFDALASTDKKPASKKSSKIAADVNDYVKTAVDNVINAKAEIARFKAEQAENESIVINHVQPQQEAKARAGQFSKSFLVEGNSGNITYTTADSFSVPKDKESHKAIKKLLGNKFDDYFEYHREVAVKSEALTPELVQKLAKVASDAGMNLGDVFEVTDTLKAKQDLDRKQFDLPEAKLNVLRTLINQKKAALK